MSFIYSRILHLCFHRYNQYITSLFSVFFTDRIIIYFEFTYLSTPDEHLSFGKNNKYIIGIERRSIHFHLKD